MKKKYTHLSYEERYAIEKLVPHGVSLREIARFLERSPNTISNEIKKHSVEGHYRADKAHKKAYHRRWRSKRHCLKVCMDRYVHQFVDRKLREKWSPEQISGYLKKEIGISCSRKAIYTFARQRCYDRYLFWGWNKRKSGPKGGWRYEKQDDGRTYIDERPHFTGIGHYEMDFIVSRKSTWVLLVLVDRLTRHTIIERVPNRKHTTVCSVLSRMLGGSTVRSITTDNDIAFACWKRIARLLNTQVYFTHPYHSWEKGLVENTNRWIRCFIPKKRDIGTVTEKELWDIQSFLNDRPRKCIGFKIPSVYHYQQLS